MQKRWLVKKTNPEFLDYLSRHASILPITAQVLINRDVKTPDQVESFLNPDLNALTDPFDLPDMDKAAERIRQAATSGESILIHGDYDADGVTATSLLLLAFRKLGIKCDYFIPNRFDHGYGFNKEAINRAERSGATIIITVDCGITSFDEIRKANERGIDVIVTDHHEPLRRDNGSYCMPDAHAVVNPKLMNSRDHAILSGAGIALKLAEALLGIDNVLEFFDIAAIGTIADMVPLIGDNRIIIKKGLHLINSGSRETILALKDAASLKDRTVNSGLLCYTIIPRINASGRVAEASEAVQLFLADNRDEARRIAQQLNSNNGRRQRIEDQVYREALAMLQTKPIEHCIVLHHKEWHEGVIGIVASKIVETFQKPTFIFSVKDGIALGSARSIPAFDICAGLAHCDDHLIRYGGHKQAAGLSLKVENIQTFEKKISEVIASSIKDDDGPPPLLIDAEVTLRDITFPLITELSKMEPFGLGNTEPLFASRDMQVVSARIVGGNHIRLRLQQNAHTLDAIGFNMKEAFESLQGHEKIDVAFVPTINEWNGSRKIQLTIKAFRHSHQ